MKHRVLTFIPLLLVSWCTMTMSHEVGHILAGLCCGGSLQKADIVPWHLPFSIFEPDPFPLVTLWAGPILGAIAPAIIAALIRHAWMWFIAYFCVIANGAYIAAAWLTGDRYLDTARLLEHGAHPLSLAVYCIATISFGYLGFRRSCFAVLCSETHEKLDIDSDDSTSLR